MAKAAQTTILTSHDGYDFSHPKRTSLNRTFPLRVGYGLSAVLTSDGSNNWSLFCWVRDNSRNDVFPIKIADAETVCDLKKAIGDENGESFQGVDARSLIPWKVGVDSLAGIITFHQVNIDMNTGFEDSQRTEVG
jgi:hypothetical protein